MSCSLVVPSLFHITKTADFLTRCRWRVTEISQIILVLLDSRCPPLHYPPSLESYLSSPHLSCKRTILVLTKVDISGPARAEAWSQYLKQRYPLLRIVQVESYANNASCKQRAHEPHIPSAFRQTLVDALKEAHVQLLQPPERIKDIPERLASWRPPVKSEINWDAVLLARGGNVGLAMSSAVVPKAKGAEAYDRFGAAMEGDGEEDEENTDPEFLTVGVIGMSI